MSPMAGGALPADQRPDDDTPVHTVDLPDTPVRDRNIPATAWVEAPRSLVELGADIGHRRVAYKRRIHGWLLWRAGPASRGDARYMALAAGDTSVRWTFRLFADGRGEGTGPSGTVHDRFRTWKEDLRDHPAPGVIAGAYSPGMVKITVLYGPPTDPAAFDAYYMERHVPLADAIPGLRRNEVSKVQGTPDGSAAPYHLQAELYFDSAEDLMAAMGTTEGQAAAADVGTFATGGVTMFISEVTKER